MISRRRRWAAALVCSLAVVACGGGEDDPAETSALDETVSTRPAENAPETSEAQTAVVEDAPGPWILDAEPLANAAGPPRMLVADGNTITRIDRGVAVEVADPERRIGRALGDGDGLVIYEEIETDRDGVDTAVRLIQLDADGTTTTLKIGAHRSVQLHDLFRVDGHTAVLYGLFRDPTDVDDEVTGRVLFHDLLTGEVVPLADAAGPEYFVSHASAADEVVALTATADLTELVEFRDWSGAPVDRPSPTDDLEYNQPPFITSAVLSPDGSEIATVEGPDVAGFSEDGDELVGGWDVVIDDRDGEQLRLTIADQSLAWVTIDFDGRWLLVSGGTTDGPVTPLLIDTEATDLASYLLDGVVGDAQLESLAGR